MNTLRIRSATRQKPSGEHWPPTLARRYQLETIQAAGRFKVYSRKERGTCWGSLLYLAERRGLYFPPNIADWQNVHLHTSVGAQQEIFRAPVLAGHDLSGTPTEKLWRLGHTNNACMAWLPACGSGEHFQLSFHVGRAQLNSRRDFWFGETARISFGTGPLAGFGGLSRKECFGRGDKGRARKVCSKLSRARLWFQSKKGNRLFHTKPLAIRSRAAGAIR